VPVKEYDITPEELLLPFPESDLPFPLEEQDDPTEAQSPDQVIPASEERSIVTF
jgi:hypothetical protein